MDFGYFTLSDNHYLSNTRTSNQFVADITAEALYAEELRMHSVWIGEHHFSSLGVLSCPDVVLAYIAARTRQVRLAPAVTVLEGLVRIVSLLAAAGLTVTLVEVAPARVPAAKSMVMVSALL